MHAYKEPTKVALYWCDWCEAWYSGAPERNPYVRLAAFEGSEEDFEYHLRNNKESWDVLQCEDSCEASDDDNPFWVFAVGEEIWFCGNCNEPHIYESNAVECCA